MSTVLIPVSVEHEGTKWSLLSSAAGEKIDDRELARQLSYEVKHLRQRTARLRAEDPDNFSPEFIEADDLVADGDQISQRRRGRLDAGAYRYTMHEALYLTTRIKTPVARQRTHQMIAVFIMAAEQRMRPAPALPSPAAQLAIETLGAALATVNAELIAVRADRAHWRSEAAGLQFDLDFWKEQAALAEQRRGPIADWYQPIARWILQTCPTELTVRQVMTMALGAREWEMTPDAQQHVKSILSRMGWHLEPYRRHGAQDYFYVRRRA